MRWLQEPCWWLLTRGIAHLRDHPNQLDNYNECLVPAAETTTKKPPLSDDYVALSTRYKRWVPREIAHDDRDAMGTASTANRCTIRYSRRESSAIIDNEIDRLRQQIAELRAQIYTQTNAYEDARTQHEQTNKRLALLEATMEAVPVDVVLADDNGRIFHGNSHVERMVRHPVLHSKDAESYGEWVSFHPDGRRVESHEYPLAQVIRDDAERSELTVNYQRGDGTFFWIQIIGEPVRDPQGNRIGAIVAVVDVDEQHRLAAGQQILIKELNHRVKNAFSVVQAIVNRSLKPLDLPEDVRTEIEQRLRSYAQAHAKLIGTSWDRADIGDVASEVVRELGRDSISISGDPLQVPSRHAITLSMVFYELATNAMKYGALSVDGGEVDLSWQTIGEPSHESVVIVWKERGGPPVAPPSRQGFGSFVLEHAIAAETRGTVKLDYDPAGLSWSLTMPANTNTWSANP